MWTLILSDGTELTGLAQNGSNYISPTKIDEAVFDGNLENLTITDGTQTISLHNAVLVQQVHYDFAEGWWLCFREKTETEQNRERIAALEEQLAAAKILLGVE